MLIDRWLVTLGVGIAMTAVACGGGREGADGVDSAQPSAAAESSAGTDSVPDPGGKVILVEMETDAAGVNKFEPADFQAKRGDVVRYVLISGVHNAHFLPDSNPGKAGLPAAGPLLQLPHQAYHVKVTWAPGTYYYQCDPHALLGMKGHVTVVP
jgi:plastocyanin